MSAVREQERGHTATITCPAIRSNPVSVTMPFRIGPSATISTGRTLRRSIEVRSVRRLTLCRHCLEEHASNAFDSSQSCLAASLRVGA